MREYRVVVIVIFKPNLTERFLSLTPVTPVSVVAPIGFAGVTPEVRIPFLTPIEPVPLEPRNELDWSVRVSPAHSSHPTVSVGGCQVEARPSQLVYRDVPKFFHKELVIHLVLDFLLIYWLLPLLTLSY